MSSFEKIVAVISVPFMLSGYTGTPSAVAQTPKCTQVALAALEAIPVDESNTDPQEAFRYYISDARHSAVKALTECIGGDLQSRVISGEIPVVVNNDHPEDPAVWGYVTTDTDRVGPDALFVDLTVRLKDGAINPDIKPAIVGVVKYTEDMRKKQFFMSRELPDEGDRLSPMNYNLSMSEELKLGDFSTDLVMYVAKEHPTSDDDTLDSVTPIDLSAGPYVMEDAKGKHLTAAEAKGIDEEVVRQIAEGLGY